MSGAANISLSRRLILVGLLGRASIIAVAAILLTLLFFRAYLRFDLSWDAIAYHYPFAARLMGICDTKCLRLAPNLEVFYSSFPLALNWIQGALWRITNRPESANLLSYFALLLLIFFLRLQFNIKWYWTTLSLLAVPFVQIFSTSAYLDMATNALAAIGVLTLAEMWVFRRPLTSISTAIFVVSVIILGNSKTQMMPVALLIVFLFLAIATRQRSFVFRWESRLLAAVASAVLLLVVCATAVRNAVVFGNPVYPVQIELMDIAIFKGIIWPLASNGTASYLMNSPQPLRWLLSVLEYAAFDMRAVPYTLGQGDVPQTAPSFRMGGYFATYVMINVGLVMLAAVKIRSLSGRVPVFVGILTVLASLLPASHDLRYYMFWIITIVGINAAIFARYENKDAVVAIIATCWRLAVVSCLISVTMITSGRYFESGSGYDIALKITGVAETVVKLSENPDDSIVCVLSERHAVLYSAAFNPGVKYKVIQGEDPSCNVHVRM